VVVIVILMGFLCAVGGWFYLAIQPRKRMHVVLPKSEKDSIDNSDVEK
jgi:hypothetical protein